eukprot:jgi/Botrbrau1/11072/Bobra.0302s0014.1
MALARCAKLARGSEAARQSIVKEGGFQTLLRLLEGHAPSLRHREVATALWSLAGLRCKNLGLLRALSQRAEDSVEYFNGADLALSVWSLASLHYQAGSPLDALALASKARLASFQPKGLSMLAWGFATLDYHPPEQLLEDIAEAARQRLPEMQPQAVANTMWGLAKFEVKNIAPLCTAVAEAVPTISGSLQVAGAVQLALGICYAAVPPRQSPDRCGSPPA